MMTNTEKSTKSFKEKGIIDGERERERETKKNRKKKKRIFI